MYIRPKKIKGYHYAYLVKSYRSKRPKKKRQKVIKYLGRIIESKKIKDLTFEEFLKKDPEKYFKKSELKEILREILTFELINHGFKKKGELYVCNECFVNLGKKKIYSNETGKDISISMNEGFLNVYTLTKLLEIGKEEGNERELGLRLANLFISAGLKIDEETYIQVFNKLLDNK